MQSRFQKATILSVSTREGRGSLRLDDSTAVVFGEAAVQVSLVQIEPDMRVSVQLGPSTVPGQLQVLRLWPGEPPAWVLHSGWHATPAEVLALLHGAGLATRFSAAELAAACYQVRFDAMLIDNDIRDVQAQVNADTLDAGTAVPGLATLYGIDGPGPVSLADHAFVLTDADEDEPEARAKVQRVLEGWAGAPLVHGQRGADSILLDAGDRLFLRQHGEGPQLYSLAGALRAGEVPLRVIALGRPERLEPWIAVRRYVRPETAAMAAGTFTGEPSQAFVEHAPGCPRCRAALLACVARGELPVELRGLLLARV